MSLIINQGLKLTIFFLFVSCFVFACGNYDPEKPPAVNSTTPSPNPDPNPYPNWTAELRIVVRHADSMEPIEGAAIDWYGSSLSPGEVFYLGTTYTNQVGYTCWTETNWVNQVYLQAHAGAAGFQDEWSAVYEFTGPDFAIEFLYLIAQQ